MIQIIYCKYKFNWIENISLLKVPGWLLQKIIKEFYQSIAENKFVQSHLKK